MDILMPTLNQMVFLFILILIGYVLVKLNVLSASAATVLSRMENAVFIPALVIGTFIKNFTVESISSAWKILLFSLVLESILVPIMIQISRRCSKDTYIQKIYTYGLCFSNFGFMGNAVVNAIFPELFTNYILFTMPLWVFIYVWGVPSLLIENDDSKKSLKNRIKACINPMFIAMILGMILGVSGLKVPAPVLSVITVSGDCMSPIAMLLTGITIAGMDLKGTLKKLDIYVVSILRLLVIPAVFLLFFAIVPLPDVIVICAICSLAMPLGLNTIVIPSAYGKDTSVAAAMALVSHLFSVVTIPVVFVFLRMIV